MKVSEQRNQEIFNAISEPIMDLRIKINKGLHLMESVDGELFKLQITIHEKVRQALNIEDQQARRECK